MRAMTRIGILAVLAALWTGRTVADDGGMPPRGPPPPPTAEMIQACAGLADGAACRFTMGDHEVAGSCRTGPQGDPAACLPARRGPPPEAFQACQGLAEGAACTVTFHGQAMGGTCRTGPGGEGALACAPQRPPRP